MFSIGTDRAPGPDGYSAGYSWETVGGDVSAAVKEFFESGRLLRQLWSNEFHYVQRNELFVELCSTMLPIL